MSTFFSRRLVLKGAGGVVAAGFLGRMYTLPASAAVSGELQVMAWEGYDMTVQGAEWRAENGVNVTTTSIAVQDDVHTPFIAGNPPPIDLAEYNQAYADLYIRQMQIVSALDPALIPNYNPDNLFDVFYDKPTWSSDGKLWGAPYIWGFNTLLYNPAKTDAPKSYSDLLDPKFKGRIAIMDDATSTWPVAARVAGLGAKYPMVTPDELGQIFTELGKYRDQARVIAMNQGELANFMASGEVDAVLCADPSILHQVRAQGVDLQYATPEEGVVLWVDAWFIPISSDNVETAHAYINLALDPKIQAQVAMAVVQAPCSKQAVALLDEEARARIDYDKIDELFAAGLPGIPPVESDGTHATYAEWIEAWQAFKAGM
jgi:spermidine/putrescine-binding protein